MRAYGSTSAASNRYVLFLSGICLDAPTPLFVQQISCGANPDDIDTPFMDTRDPHERTHTAFAAIRAAVTHALGLPADHFLYYSYRAVNLRLRARLRARRYPAAGKCRRLCARRANPGYPGRASSRSDRPDLS